MSRPVVAFLVLAGALTLSVTPSAALSPERQACDGSEPQYSLDQQIAGCTSVIEGGGISSNDLASAYSNRAVAYYGKHLYQRAVDDNNRAIELKPDFGNAFWGRAMAYAKLQKCALATADADKSFSLDPKSTARESVSNICAAK